MKKKSVTYKVFTEYLGSDCFEGSFSTKKQALDCVNRIRTFYCTDSRYTGVYIVCETISIVEDYDF